MPPRILGWMIMARQAYSHVAITCSQGLAVFRLPRRAGVFPRAVKLCVMKNRIRWLLLLALSLGPALLRAADVTVAVDPALDRHPVSPLIYGVSFGNDTDVAGRRWTVRR